MAEGACIDLFAGAGGFSLAAEQAGYEVEHAIEIDRWACDTLKRNHPATTVHCQDISELSDDWLRRNLPSGPSLLIGGPPCQGFSRAGPADKDPRDPRNSLFREFVRAARILEPESIVLENVPGILRARTAEGDSVCEIIEEEFRAIGYQVRRLVLEAERFGVPQLRRRVFFIGTLDGVPAATVEPTHGERIELFGSIDPILTVRDAIADLPHVDVGYRETTVRYIGPPTNKYQREMRLGASELLENHTPMRHSPRMIERFKLIPPGRGQSHITNPEHAPRRRIRKKDDSASSYDQNNRRMHWDKPCHTLAASFYANFLHPELHRNFTPREGARIQTFPDHYVFEGKPTVVSTKLLTREGRMNERHLCQYQQIGNAVPPRLGRAVLDTLKSGSRTNSELPSREAISVEA